MDLQLGLVFTELCSTLSVVELGRFYRPWDSFFSIGSTVGGWSWRTLFSGWLRIAFWTVCSLVYIFSDGLVFVCRNDSVG